MFYMLLLASIVPMTTPNVTILCDQLVMAWVIPHLTDLQQTQINTLSSYCNSCQGLDVYHYRDVMTIILIIHFIHANVIVWSI